MKGLANFQEQRLFDRYPFFTGRLPETLEEKARVEFEALWNLHPSGFHRAVIHGRTVALPRWQQAYGRDYQYTGSVNRALPIPGLLTPFLAWVREAVDDRLNGLLLNWYNADRRHYIGAHRDSRVGLVTGSPIVTVSAGATRTFRLRLQKEKGFVDFEASASTVFVMPWETNLAVKHEVPHSASAKGRRISITARAFANRAPSA